MCTIKAAALSWCHTLFQDAMENVLMCALDFVANRERCESTNVCRCTMHNEPWPLTPCCRIKSYDILSDVEYQIMAIDCESQLAIDKMQLDDDCCCDIAMIPLRCTCQIFNQINHSWRLAGTVSLTKVRWQSSLVYTAKVHFQLQISNPNQQFIKKSGSFNKKKFNLIIVKGIWHDFGNKQI